MRTLRHSVALIATLALFVGAGGIAAAAVFTDQADYSPGSTVTISGVWRLAPRHIWRRSANVRSASRTWRRGRPTCHRRTACASPSPTTPG